MSVGRAIRHVGRPEGSWTLTMEDAMTAFQLFSYWESLPSAPLPELFTPVIARGDIYVMKPIHCTLLMKLDRSVP